MSGSAHSQESEDMGDILMINDYFQDSHDLDFKSLEDTQG